MQRRFVAYCYADLCLSTVHCDVVACIIFETMETYSSNRSKAALCVAIGCGAGGTSALCELLNALLLPADLSLLIVTHSEPLEMARLGDALVPASGLTLRSVADNVDVSQPGVYVLDKDADFIVRQGKFHQRAFDSSDHALSSVDRLMQSLASDMGARSAGVLLSGSGSDGTLGLKAISDAGGMTIAQSPEDAEFDLMPRAAIDAGVVDHVLATTNIGRELLDHSRHLQECELNDPEDLDRCIEGAIPDIARILLQHTGHNFQHYKSSTLVRRIRRRMQVLHLGSVPAYRRVLLSDACQVQTLFRELLIGVTAFFRDEDAFAALVRQTFGDLFAGKGHGDTVRIWVPGCASGQEAYTLAMLVCEHLDEVTDKPDVRIFASDIDEQALAIARKGSYPVGIANEVSAERLQRFFRKSDRHYQVSKRLREMVLFSTHNVIADPPFSNLDLVSCRNLLIYLGYHLQEKLIPVFHYALKPEGHLFLGSSENLQAHKNLFAPIDERHRISRRCEVDQVLSSLPDPQGMRRQTVMKDTEARDLGAIAQRIVLDEFMPQWAIVNDEFQILELSDNASRYLEVGAGTFQNNIIRLAQNSLQSGLRSLLRQARDERLKVVHDRLLLHLENGLKRVTLTVQPMPGIGSDDEMLMVIFQESGALISAEQPPVKNESDEQFQQSQSMIFQLEEELSTTQADLARTVQDLETANEELKSSNEELLSINEELHFSNEELETSKEEIENSHSALARANDDLENLLISSQTATLFLDEDLRIKWFTPAICDIYNLIEADVGRSILDITHNVECMPVLPGQAQLASADLDSQEQVQTLDGLCYLRRVLPYHRADNQPSGVVVTFTDITHTMAAEQFTRNVINSLRSFVGVCSTDGTLLQANQSALVAAGISYADVFGKPFRETPWWNSLPESQRLLDEAIVRAAAGESSRFDVEIILKGNEKATVDFQIEPMRSSDGSITHLIPSAIDVTHRRQMEVALELAELKSRSLLQEIEDIYNSAPIGLCVLDTNLRWTRINEHLAEINGIAVADHIGKSLTELLPDIAEKAVPLLQGILDSGEAVRNIPLSGTTPAQPGVNRHWVESWIPMHDQNDTVVGINIVAEEVTRQRQSEERLQVLKQQAEEAREQAENANRFKSEFLANMSHEIRTPMTAILGYADLLESHLTDPDNLQSVRTIKRNGRFLINLINDILDLSKIESGKLELELVPVSPVDIIEQTLDMMQLQADRKQLSLGVEYVGKLPITLETDPTRLRQILINLTGNAVKFTEHGSVTLRVEYWGTPEPSLFFHVIDTGIGMTLEQQTEVFAAFRQADSSISRRFGGSGLGLAISQRLAASMGGDICIHSELGKGSTLTLKLPAGVLGQVELVTPEKPVTADSAEALQIPELPYRLLAVDDRRDILHVVQHILEDAGATVSTASGAAEAFDKVQQAQAAGSGFQAIVLDMQMPGINGYDAATVLRERGFNEPIIALTANAMKGEREKCLAAGCTDYLTKPIDRHLLIEALDRHVAHPTSQKVAVSRQCILLVEDHVESAQVLVRLLERSGHIVHSAHSAAQAMSILESIQPTVILSDIGLPDEDGYSLVARMRKHHGLKSCIFVALTGRSELDEMHQNVFDHHMTKPVEIEHLRNFLRQPVKAAVITG